MASEVAARMRHRTLAFLCEQPFSLELIAPFAAAWYRRQYKQKRKSSWAVRTLLGAGSGASASGPSGSAMPSSSSLGGLASPRSVGPPPQQPPALAEAAAAASAEPAQQAQQETAPGTAAQATDQVGRSPA